MRVSLESRVLGGWRGKSAGGALGLPVEGRTARQHDSFYDPATFSAAHGVRTLSRLESMYSTVPSGNPSNWLGPVWILANCLVWQGLRRYGFAGAAAGLAGKTVRLLQADVAATGDAREYYHPDTGEPLKNKGFLSWNLLSLEMEEALANQPPASHV